MSAIAPIETLFKGYPVLKIHLGKKYQSDEDDYMILGVKKAKIICDQIDYIRRFADKNEKG